MRPAELQKRIAFLSTPNTSPESVRRPLSTSPSNSGVDGMRVGVIARGSGEGFQAAWGINRCDKAAAAAFRGIAGHDAHLGRNVDLENEFTGTSVYGDRSPPA